jgi:hypothetical protein
MKGIKARRIRPVAKKVVTPAKTDMTMIAAPTAPSEAQTSSFE